MFIKHSVALFHNRLFLYHSRSNFFSKHNNTKSARRVVGWRETYPHMLVRLTQWLYFKSMMHCHVFSIVLPFPYIRSFKCFSWSLKDLLPISTQSSTLFVRRKHLVPDAGRRYRKDSISLRKRLKMSGKALQVAKVYRHLLKAMKKHVAKEENKRHFIKYATEEFRNNCKPSDPSSIQHKIKLAENYTLLLNSVHHHKDLLFSYNIAVDRTDEMKTVLGKSAASVGLQLPDVYQP